MVEFCRKTKKSLQTASKSNLQALKDVMSLFFKFGFQPCQKLLAVKVCEYRKPLRTKEFFQLNEVFPQFSVIPTVGIFFRPFAVIFDRLKNNCVCQVLVRVDIRRWPVFNGCSKRHTVHFYMIHDLFITCLCLFVFVILSKFNRKNFVAKRVQIPSKVFLSRFWKQKSAHE